MAKKTSRKQTAKRPSPRKRTAPRAQARAEEPEPPPIPLESNIDDISPADLTALKDGKLY